MALIARVMIETQPAIALGGRSMPRRVPEISLCKILR